MFGWTSENWKMIGKYGVPTVFAVVLLGFFFVHFTRQADQLDELHETNKNIAVSNEKVAGVLDSFKDTTEDLTAEIDDVGDAMRIMAESNKNQLEANRAVLEKIYKQQKDGP
jgi:cell division protein FtsB